MGGGAGVESVQKGGLAGLLMPGLGRQEGCCPPAHAYPVLPTTKPSLHLQPLPHPLCRRPSPPPPFPRTGVGISGQEGMQAVMASDFAIAQFRFLTPLLLVHGRLSYKRITRMINFFFYKNLLFGITIFVFNGFALFSGQPIYNDFYMAMYNVVFTLAMPLVVGWFDRDVDKSYGLRFPQLYREGGWGVVKVGVGRAWARCGLLMGGEGR